MKSTIAAVAALALAGAPLAASADGFTPQGTKFTLSGPLIFTFKPNFPVPCTVTMHGQTLTTPPHHSGARITGASIEGANPACAVLRIFPPFHVNVTGPATARLKGFQIAGFGESRCPMSINFAISPGGQWTASSIFSGCRVTGTLTSTPPVTIAQ